MSLKQRHQKEQRAVTSTGIRAGSLERLQTFARENRMANVDFIDCLMDGWETLSTDQQVSVIRRLSETEASAK